MDNEKPKRAHRLGVRSATARCARLRYANAKAMPTLSNSVMKRKPHLLPMYVPKVLPMCVPAAHPNPLPEADRRWFRWSR